MYGVLLEGSYLGSELLEVSLTGLLTLVTTSHLESLACVRVWGRPDDVCTRCVGKAAMSNKMCFCGVSLLETKNGAKVSTQ